MRGRRPPCAPWLADRPGVRGPSFRGSRGADGHRRRRDGGPRTAGIRQGHGRPRNGGPRPDRHPQEDLRQGRRPGACLVRPAAHRGRGAVGGRRRGTARDLFRRVPSHPADRHRHAGRHLRLRRLSRPAGRRRPRHRGRPRPRPADGLPPPRLPGEHQPLAGLRRVRRRVPRCRAGPRHAQGLRPEHGQGPWPWRRRRRLSPSARCG